MLQVERQAAIGIHGQLGQHRRVDQIAIDRVGHEELRLGVVDGQRPERVDRRQVACREMQRIAGAAAIRRAAGRVGVVRDVDRFFRGIAVDPVPGPHGAVEGASLEEFAAPEERAAGAERQEVRGDRGVGVVDARRQRRLHLRRKRRRIERLAGRDPDPGDPGPDALVFRQHRRELQQEAQVLKEADPRGLLLLVGQPVDGRRRRWRGLAEILAQRLGRVSRLHLLHVVEIVRPEELCAGEAEPQFGRQPQHHGNPFRRLPRPTRPGEEEPAAAIAGGAAADVRRQVGVEVDVLPAEVAILPDRINREDDRLGAQVQHHEGVGRVGVGRDHSGVRGGVDPRDIADLVERRLVVGAAFVDGVGVDRLVVLDDGEAVDEGVPGDGPRLLGRQGASFCVRGGRGRGGLRQRIPWAFPPSGTGRQRDSGGRRTLEHAPPRQDRGQGDVTATRHDDPPSFFGMASARAGFNPHLRRSNPAPSIVPALAPLPTSVGTTKTSSSPTTESAAASRTARPASATPSRVSEANAPMPWRMSMGTAPAATTPQASASAPLPAVAAASPARLATMCAAAIP